MKEPPKKKKKNRVRIVPKKEGGFFALNHPFHAYLSDTDNPRIKTLKPEKSPRINKELDAVWDKLKSAQTDKGIKPLSGEAPLNFVTYNVLEICNLILDESNASQQKQTFKVLHHAFKTILNIRKTSEGGVLGPDNERRLLALMEDLERFKLIAEDEEKNSKRKGMI